MTYIRVKRITPTAILPTYGSPGAIGLDVAAIDNQIIRPGERRAIGTGLAVEIPPGYYGRVAPRSGLALRYGIDVLAGVIDSDYRGEIQVILQNHGDAAVHVTQGMRVAQLILERADRLATVEVEELGDTDRGAAGFGSTG